MPRQQLMSWEGRPYYRWVKMHKGVRYRVSCEELQAKDWTREATWKLANAWWEKKQLELGVVTPDLLATANSRVNARMDEVVEAAFDQTDHAGKKLILKTYQRLLSEENPVVPPEDTVGHAIDEFLSVWRSAKDPKAKTYQEVKDFTETIRKWWGDIPCKEIKEPKITAAWTAIAEMKISSGKKKKRWNILRRFVSHAVETNRCDLPKNLHSKNLLFKVKRKEVKTWPVETVRAELKALPDRYRLYALLGLNCGMTNSDISELRKDMVKDGILTRRRVKTGDNEAVPTVSYRLWPETIALLNQFKSDHPELWFVTRSRSGNAGQKLVDHRIVNGQVKTKDMIQTNWRRVAAGQPIPLAKFRSVAAAKLLEGGHHHFVQHFLGHVPTTIAEENYAPMSAASQRFYEALDWLRTAILGQEPKKEAETKGERHETGQHQAQTQDPGHATSGPTDKPARLEPDR